MFAVCLAVICYINKPFLWYWKTSMFWAVILYNQDFGKGLEKWLKILTVQKLFSLPYSLWYSCKNVLQTKNGTLSLWKQGFTCQVEKVSWCYVSSCCTRTHKHLYVNCRHIYECFAVCAYCKFYTSILW